MCYEYAHTHDNTNTRTRTLSPPSLSVTFKRIMQSNTDFKIHAINQTRTYMRTIICTVTHSNTFTCAHFYTDMNTFK